MSQQSVAALTAAALLALLVLSWAPARAGDFRPDPAVRMDFPPAPYSQGWCEDQLGNEYQLPLERYQSGMMPIGPCLPVGTWGAIRPVPSGEVRVWPPVTDAWPAPPLLTGPRGP
jgi:hypothetical protein